MPSIGTSMQASWTSGFQIGDFRRPAKATVFANQAAAGRLERQGAASAEICNPKSSILKTRDPVPAFFEPPDGGFPVPEHGDPDRQIALRV